MIQAGAVDQRARKMVFDDELMGELIRFVASHEVGHTLGLRHNMGASYATPVERLRDNDWLTENGHTSSIMDYARFNYVAQPEDSIDVENLMPRIGDYDKWAIQWGYSKLADTLSPSRKQLHLAQLVTDSVAKNPRLWFSGEGRDFDPRSQTEDLGDNAMTASYYGIKNLKRILPNIIKWTDSEQNDNYTNLNQVYQSIVSQYKDYMYHVAKNIGGIYVTQKSRAQEGPIYQAVPKRKQKEALMFLNSYLFTEPQWLLNDTILNIIEEPKSKDAVTKMMEGMMTTLLGGSRISRISFIAERYQSNNPYKPQEYLEDITNYIWSSLDVFYDPNAYQRELQKNYVSNMIALYSPDKADSPLRLLMAKLSENKTSNTDIRSLALNHLIKLHGRINRILPRVDDDIVRAHLLYIEKQIEEAVGEVDDSSIPFRPILN